MEVVILIGLQGAGKSTFYQTRLASTHVHISMDHFPNASNRRLRQLRLLEGALQQGHSAAIDNTNPTAADRASLIQTAHSLGATVVGYYFESSLADCLSRNSQRTGRARVPDRALFTTIHKLERPTSGEGFAQLFYVRALASAEGQPDSSPEFEIAEWREELE